MKDEELLSSLPKIKCEQSHFVVVHIIYGKFFNGAAT